MRRKSNNQHQEQAASSTGAAWYTGSSSGRPSSEQAIKGGSTVGARAVPQRAYRGHLQSCHVPVTQQLALSSFLSLLVCTCSLYLSLSPERLLCVRRAKHTDWGVGAFESASRATGAACACVCVYYWAAVCLCVSSSVCVPGGGCAVVAYFVAAGQTYTHLRTGLVILYALVVDPSATKDKVPRKLSRTVYGSVGYSELFLRRGKNTTAYWCETLNVVVIVHSTTYRAY